jgi:hypothetical protein
VTIVIACAFRDGVLFCADNKITTGQEKSFESKIYARQWGENNNCVTVFTASGNTDYATAAIEKCERVIAGVNFSKTSLNEIQDRIEGTLATFYHMHLFPNPDKNSMDLSFLIGLWLNGETRILASTDATLRRVNGYECVGSGGYLARYWLRQALGSETAFDPNSLSVEEASLILEHAIDSAVEYDEACGYEGFGGEAEYTGMMRDGSIGDIRGNTYLFKFPAELRTASWELLRRLAISKRSNEIELVVERFCDEIREMGRDIAETYRELEVIGALAMKVKEASGSDGAE